MQEKRVEKIIAKLQVGNSSSTQSKDAIKEITLVDFLHQETQLSKSLLKKILSWGGVFYHKSTTLGSNPPKQQIHRVRRAQLKLTKGEWIFLYYDPNLDFPSKELQQQVKPLLDERDFSIWLKPANILSQGTEFGDEGCLLRIVEKYFEMNRSKFPGPRRKAFLVHRLDRETAGPVIIAHNGKTAQILSKYFETRQVKKIYHAIVVAQKPITAENKRGIWNYSLQGQEAITYFEIEKEFNKERQYFYLVQLNPHTGRFHQLRRHAELAGTPIWGDPLYGQGNKNDFGLQLACTQIHFPHPQSGKSVDIQLPVSQFLVFSQLH